MQMQQQHRPVVSSPTSTAEQMDLKVSEWNGVAGSSMRIFMEHLARPPSVHAIFAVQVLMAVVLDYIGPIVARVQRADLTISDHAGHRTVRTLPDGTLLVEKRMVAVVYLTNKGRSHFLCRREWPATGDVSCSCAMRVYSCDGAICDRGVLLAEVGGRSQPTQLLDWRKLTPVPREGGTSVVDWLSHVGAPPTIPLTGKLTGDPVTWHPEAGILMAISFDGSMVITSGVASDREILLLYRVEYPDKEKDPGALLARDRTMYNPPQGTFGRPHAAGFVVGTTRVYGVYTNIQTNRRMIFIESASSDNSADVDLMDLGTDVMIEDGGMSSPFDVKLVYPTFVVAYNRFDQIHRLLAIPIRKPFAQKSSIVEGYPILPIPPRPPEAIGPGTVWTSDRPPSFLRAYPLRFVYEVQREVDGAWYLQPFDVSTTDSRAGLDPDPRAWYLNSFSVSPADLCATQQPPPSNDSTFLSLD